MGSGNAASAKSGQNGQKRNAKLEEEATSSSERQKRLCTEKQTDEQTKPPRAGSNRALRLDIKNAENTIRGLQKKCSRLGQEICKLKEQNKEFEKEVLELREARGVERMDDSEIRSLFDGLTSMYSMWAQDYSPQEPIDLGAFKHDKLPIDEEEKGMMHAILSGTYSALEHARYGKFIFLNTLLAHFACWFIIDHPLFFLKREFSGRRSGYPQEFFSELIQAQPDHMKEEWIGCTLRTLFPIRHNHCHMDFAVYNKIIGQTNTFYEQCADRFLNVCEPILKPLSAGVIADRHRRLVRVMATTGDLALKLRQQNYNIKSVSHDSKALSSQRFSREFRLMEPHPAMRLRPDDSKLDGSVIHFAIQPAILAEWFDEDSREIQQKVWAKAVVWVDGGEQTCAGTTAGGMHVGVRNAEGKPDFIQQNADNSACEPTASMQPLPSVNDTVTSSSNHTRLSPSGMEGIQVPLFVANVYSNESHEMQASDPDGLDTRVASVETHPDTTRSGLAFHPGTMTGEAADRPVNTSDEIISNTNSDVLQICPKTEASDEPSKFDSMPNKSDPDYAPQARNESDDELGEQIPSRKPKTRSQSNNSKKEDHRFTNGGHGTHAVPASTSLKGCSSTTYAP